MNAFSSVKHWGGSHQQIIKRRNNILFLLSERHHKVKESPYNEPFSLLGQYLDLHFIPDACKCYNYVIASTVEGPSTILVAGYYNDS